MADIELTDGEKHALTQAVTRAGIRDARSVEYLHEAVAHFVGARLAAVAALADEWERDNRRPSGPSDQVAAGVWSATKHDVAELRAVLRDARYRPGQTS